MLMLKKSRIESSARNLEDALIGCTFSEFTEAEKMALYSAFEALRRTVPPPPSEPELRPALEEPVQAGLVYFDNGDY